MIAVNYRRHPEALARQLSLAFEALFELLVVEPPRVVKQAFALMRHREQNNPQAVVSVERKASLSSLPRRFWNSLQKCVARVLAHFQTA